MKRKKENFRYILLTATVVICMSCAKLLDVPPQGKLTLDQFWKSKEQATAAIAGVYSNLGSTNSDFAGGNLSANAMSPIESYIYWGEIRGELMKSNQGKLPTDQVPKENIDNFIVTPNDVTTKYTGFYKIINEANQAIKNIPNVQKKDPLFTDMDRDQLMGEAYFLRAFAYFWLVRTFKEIPLILQPSESDNQDYNIPKSSSDTIFSQIVKDLELAKNTLPEWYDINNYAHCRATKYTAMTVLADAYLWMAALDKNGTLKDAYYQKAIDNCDAIINSGRYFMVHGSTLGTVFSSGGTTESIFETYSNSTLNNQVNNLRDWFNSTQYYSVTPNVVSLFSSIPDYRGGVGVPTGPFPPAGSVFSFSASSYQLLKYSKSTKDAIWNFYRYSEVLLMKAEALTHLYTDDPAKLQNASDLINQVRYRAYGVLNYPKVTASSTLEMDDILLDERGREFIGEGKRWFDLLRFASRNNFSNPGLLIERIVQSYQGVDQLLIRPRINNPDSWYLPLNADAISSNSKLVQNPYYE